MGYNGDDDDDDLPEAPPIQMITETFSEVKVTPERNIPNNHDKE